MTSDVFKWNLFLFLQKTDYFKIHNLFQNSVLHYTVENVVMEQHIFYIVIDYRVHQWKGITINIGS